MESLPNKSFVFNYNARDYNTSTFTIPNEAGATMDRDMVITATTTTVRNQVVFNDDYITVPTSAISTFDFSSSGANPLNITSSSKNMTIVAKCRRISWTNFLGSRIGATYPNWINRTGGSGISFHDGSSSHTSGGDYAPYDSGAVVTFWIRVNNLSVEIKNMTSGQSNTPFNMSPGTGVASFSFFASRTSISSADLVVEPGSGDFYWCYCSREVLTDEEIQQVIKFNESNFGPDSTGTTIAQSGGTSTTNIESETGWTVTTKPTWVTVSPSSGESGTTAITFTIKKNNFSSRTGVVLFTDDEGNTAEYTIDQGGTENQLPYDKMFRNNRRLN